MILFNPETNNLLLKDMQTSQCARYYSEISITKYAHDQKIEKSNNLNSARTSKPKGIKRTAQMG